MLRRLLLSTLRPPPESNRDKFQQNLHSHAHPVVFKCSHTKKSNATIEKSFVTPL